MWSLLVLSLIACEGTPAKDSDDTADTASPQTEFVGTWWEITAWPQGRPYPVSMEFCPDREECQNCVMFREDGQALSVLWHNALGGYYVHDWSYDYGTGSVDYYLLSNATWAVHDQDADGLRYVETGIREDREWTTDIRTLTLAEGCPFDTSGIDW